MNSKEKLIIASACIVTTIVSAGFSITQGKIKSTEKEYKPTDITNQIDNHVNYKILEKDNSKKSYIIETNEDTNNENLLSIANDINKENNEKCSIYIYDENDIYIQMTQTDKETIITRYTKVEEETEGLPTEYKVLAIEPFEEKTRISIEIPKSDDVNLVLGQIKSIGQEVKEDEISKGNEMKSLEIKAYYNQENSYWSYSSSNKDIVMHNQVIPK